MRSGIENPSKLEVIGRCGGDGKNRRRTDKSLDFTELYMERIILSICVCTWSDLLFMVEKHLTVFTCLTPSFKANKERQCGSKIM